MIMMSNCSIGHGIRISATFAVGSSGNGKKVLRGNNAGQLGLCLRDSRSNRSECCSRSSTAGVILVVAIRDSLDCAHSSIMCSDNCNGVVAVLVVGRLLLNSLSFKQFW